MAIKTLKIRIKDKHATQLTQMSRAVNFVWNFINDLSFRSITERIGHKKQFLSEFDIHKYTKGASRELGIHSQSVQEVAKEYVTRRKQFKKAKLKWRKSQGTRRSLGWIPFTGQAIKYVNGQIKHNGTYFKIWDSYGLSQYTLKSGCFSEDARGRWYFCVAVDVNVNKSTGTKSVGLDLGCKSTVTDSNGDGIEGREYRKLQEKLGKAQRANKKNRVKAIHAKIKNKRKDSIHKYTTKIVAENAAIFVGNVNSQAMIKTTMAKSVLDSAWGILKTTLEYKCEHAGVIFEVVNEAYTSQTCSSCGANPPSSPKGRAGLGIREWTCTACGTTHDRDINAAKNILAAGHRRLDVGIPVL